MTVVLVTGCSSGIGRRASIALRDAGCQVVATARDPASLEGLDSMDHLRLDVTDDSLDEAVAETLRRHGRIDAVVNNAGYGTILPLEEIPEEAMRAMFEVNLFGVHRLTRSILPAMRQNGHGRIVNVSSAAGHVSLPLMGGYCATKHALRAYTKALRSEVHAFGIHASLVEPGQVVTEFARRSEQERNQWAPEEARAGPYAPLHQAWNHVRSMSRGGDADMIARQVVHAVTARRPRPHYRAPMDSKAGVLAAKWLPEHWQDLVVRAYFRYAARR